MTRLIKLDPKKKTHKIVLKEKGQYVVFFYNLSGEVFVEIEEQGIEVFILGLYIGKAEDEFVLKTRQHHKVGDSHSDLLVKGVFFDKARFLYEGLIRIEKNAQKSAAYQKNQNLVLSPQVYVESRPFLEILANDVFCTHGSTTGGLNKDELFYLKTRGLSESKAKKLLIEGFLNEVFEKAEEIGVKLEKDSILDAL